MCCCMVLWVLLSSTHIQQQCKRIEFLALDLLGIFSQYAQNNALTSDTHTLMRMLGLFCVTHFDMNRRSVALGGYLFEPHGQSPPPPQIVSNFISIRTIICLLYIYKSSNKIQGVQNKMFTISTFQCIYFINIYFN